jgi:hypothetical protein
MKEILAKILHFCSLLKVKLICLFKLTFSFGEKEDDSTINKEDKHE